MQLYYVDYVFAGILPKKDLITSMTGYFIDGVLSGFSQQYEPKTEYKLNISRIKAG